MGPPRAHRPGAGALAALCALSAACPASGPEDPGGPATLVLKHFQVSGGAGPLLELLAEFEAENPDVRVTSEVLPASSDQQHQFYVTQLQARTRDFDVFALDVIWAAELARAGWLLPLGDVVDAELAADLFAGPLAAVTFEGRPHAAPWFVDGGMLYYRRDLLEKHGLAPPETWEELASTARAVLAAEDDPRFYGHLWQGRQYEGLVCVALEVVHSNGGAFLEDGRVRIGDPETLEALRFLRGLVREGISPPLVTTLDEEGARHLFQSGRALYMRNWPYARPLLEAEGSPVRGKVGTSVLPRFEGGRHVATLGGWQLGVNARTRHPEAAKRLVRFFLSREAQLRLALEVGFAPARRSLYSDPRLASERPFLAALLPVLERAEPRPTSPWYPRIAQILQAELSAIVTGIRAPEEAARRARVQIEHVLAAEEHR